LIDGEGYEVFGFDALEEGGKYTLGPPKSKSTKFNQVSGDHIEKLAAFVEAELEDRTISKCM
jgi:hypothetical protein